MNRLRERLDRDLREIAGSARPSPGAWESIVARLDDVEGSEIALRAVPIPDRSGRPAWVLAAAAAVAVVVASTVVVRSLGDDRSVSIYTDSTTPVTDPESTLPGPAPFVGSWVSTDTDGSSQTMVITSSGTGEYAIVVHDEAATAACAGAAATLTGTGVLETDERLVLAQPGLSCDDGTTPAIGPPPQVELAGFTLELDIDADEIVDSFAVVWRRAGSTDEETPRPEGTVPAVGAATSGGMWPQSTRGELLAAQERADAGDPAHTWQLFAQSSPGAEPWAARILTRFLEEGLGWEDHVPLFYAYAERGGGYAEVVVIRCAPGRTNPLAPLFADIPPKIRGCAPTIDESTYETVMLSLEQPVRRSVAGIWVVQQWEILQPRSGGPLYWLIRPDLGQVRQAVPPSDDEVDAFLTGFLRARLAGDGAEEYLLTEEGSLRTQPPLLYATSGGVPYARYTTPLLVRGPVWPTGWREYVVRLLADDGTVVEQHFNLVSDRGRLGLIYGFTDGDDRTTEDGEPVAVPQSEFRDTVTFMAPPMVPHGDGSEEIRLTGAGVDGRMAMSVDPHPELCGATPRAGEQVEPADAATVASSILALPGVEAGEPVPVRIAGADGLMIDVTSTGRNECLAPWGWMNDLMASYGTWRMRVYLVDVPEGIVPADPESGWRPGVLAVTVVAPLDGFEAVHALATPILESLAFPQS